MGGGSIADRWLLLAGLGPAGEAPPDGGGHQRQPGHPEYPVSERMTALADPDALARTIDAVVAITRGARGRWSASTSRHNT
jgi:hypothetical protein